MRNEIYNFRENSAISDKYKDLSETTPFIDYIQLHCSSVPLSYMLCREDANNRFRFLLNGKFLDYECKEIGDTTVQYTLSNSVRFYFYSFKWDDTLRVGTSAKLKIYIPPSAIPDDYLNKQIDEIWKIVFSIRPAVYYGKANLEGHHMNSILNLHDCTLSRIDLAINCFKSNYFLNGKLVNDFNFEDLRVTTKKKNKTTKHYNGDYCTGITIGQGKRTVQLKCYDKEVDPNNHHDYERFGRVDFARLEYKVPRYIFKQIKYNDDILLNSVVDLNPVKILTLWNYCLNNKHINLWSLYRVKYLRPDLIKTSTKIVPVRFYQQIKGLLKKFKHIPNYNRVSKSVDNFFEKELKVDEKTIKDTNTIIYN